MDKETVEALLNYVNQGIKNNQVTAEEAKEALEKLGISFGEVEQDPDSLEFVRPVEFKFA